MKYLKTFENKDKPEIDEKTIRVEGSAWYVDIYFDSIDRVDYVDNPWNINIPDWYGLKVSSILVKGTFLDKGYRCKVYNILDHMTKKYNL